MVGTKCIGALVAYIAWASLEVRAKERFCEMFDGRHSSCSAFIRFLLVKLARERIDTESVLGEERIGTRNILYDGAQIFRSLMKSDLQSILFMGRRNGS